MFAQGVDSVRPTSTAFQTLDAASIEANLALELTSQGTVAPVLHAVTAMRTPVPTHTPLTIQTTTRRILEASSHETDLTAPVVRTSQQCRILSLPRPLVSNTLSPVYIIIPMMIYPMASISHTITHCLQQSKERPQHSLP
jgi:hypothetical protein